MPSTTHLSLKPLDLSAEGPTYMPSDTEDEVSIGNEEENDEEDLYVCLEETDAEKQKTAYAEASRPYRQLLDGRPKKPQGRKRIHGYQRSSRINWFNYILWQQINGAMVKACWSPQAALSLLMDWNPEVFRHLHRQSLSRWVEHRNGFSLQRWSESTLVRAERGKPIHVTNRAGILDKYPEVKNKIILQLRSIRATGCRINLIGVQAVVISYVTISIPSLFEETRWKVSDSWTRSFLRNVMGWSLRRGTTAAQKLPDTWEQDAIKVCLRMAYLIRIYGIPACLIINMDETGVLLQPGGEVTYHDKGALDVPITGAEDKRQFTLLCTCAMDGALLPFAALWKGLTVASLPKPVDEYYNMALDNGHRFFFAGNKHWSTVETMILWVEQVVLPYRARVLQRFPHYATKPMILYLDVYWCHRANDFIAWLDSDEQRNKSGCRFIVLFVPANTTSVCQPCDVGLQRPIKHELRRQHMTTAIMETCDQLRVHSPENVRLKVTLGHLRNQTPRWLHNTYQVVQKTDAVKLSWARSCRTGIFNLSYETLTGVDVWNHIDNLRVTDPEFAEVLMHPRSTTTIVPKLDGHKVIVEALEPGQTIPNELLDFSTIEGPTQWGGNWEDGSEVQTCDLIPLMHGLEVIETGISVGINERGSFFLSAPEEDVNFGYAEGYEAGVEGPPMTPLDFIMS